jgi:hypothetical protein
MTFPTLSGKFADWMARFHGEAAEIGEVPEFRQAMEVAFFTGAAAALGIEAVIAAARVSNRATQEETCAAFSALRQEVNRVKEARVALLEHNKHHVRRG